MCQKQIADFLKPGLNQIRHQILEIDDSYNHDWDLLAELCQNSIDAIRESDNKTGEIVLEIDSQLKKIRLVDNGIGIDPNDLPELLKPFSTNKRGKAISIGEKGVGLTFVMFSCNHFSIKSGNKNGTSIGKVTDGHNWKHRSDNEPLTLVYNKLDDVFFGTELILTDTIDCPIFTWTFEQLKFILRTKTALGNTKSIWEEDKNVKIILRFKDQSGNDFEEELPYKYWLIYENLPSNSIIDYDDFVTFARSAERTDAEKRKKLKDRIIYKKGEFKHSDQRKLKYVTCFVPKRKVWDILSVKNKLCDEDQLEREEWLDRFGYAKFEEGIFTSVKGMPTGIPTNSPSTGYAGYWANIFILIEDPMLKFDIGRKSLPGAQSRLIQQYSRQIFNDYLKFVTKYVSGEVTVTSEWDRDEIFAEIDKMLNLTIKGIKLKKNPRNQEASVFALFFECIGNGRISDITPLTMGYRSKYDLYALWGSKKLVIEFKSKLKNIIKDFSDAKKMFDEINCIVCWDVTEEDIQAFKKVGVDLEEISASIFSKSDDVIPNSTHKLSLSGFTRPIYIIDLKKHLNSAE